MLYPVEPVVAPRQIHNYDSGVSSLCRRLEYGRERIVQKDTVHVHPFLLCFLRVYLCCAGAPVDEPSVLLVWNWAYPFLVTRRVATVGLRRCWIIDKPLLTLDEVIGRCFRI